MKTITLSILITLIFTNVFGQQNDNSIKIKNIEQIVQKINSVTNYKVISLYNEAFLDSGFINQPAKGFGQLTGYFKNDTLCKIREYYGLKQVHDFAATDYYFSGGKLIYIHEEENYNPNVSIDSSGTVDYKTQKPDFEGSYYFIDNTMITKAEGKQMLLPNEMYFDSQSKEGQLLDFVEKYKELLAKAKKK